MKNSQKLAQLEQLFERLVPYGNCKFTGKIKVQVSSQVKVTIYLNLGHLAWITDQSYLSKRWEKHLINTGLCKKVIKETTNLGDNADSKLTSCEYDQLVILAKNNYLSREQVREIIKNLTEEILLNLLQETPLPTTQSPFYITAESGVRPSSQYSLPHTWLCSIASVQTSLRSFYQQWLNAGLSDYSPNLIPYLNDQQGLARKTTPNIYQKLLSLLDGTHTIREIIIKMQLDIKQVIGSLSTLIKAQIIILASSFNQISKPRMSSQSKRYSLNIIAIDDNLQTLRILDEIITQTGHKFTGVTNPIDALPTLLDNKPDLIFIDLNMPLLNGYELCQKIQTVNRLKSVPIIFLVGNRLDRVRSRFAGATQSLQKPLITYKVREVVTYYEKKKRSVATSPQLSSDTFPSQPQFNLAN